MLSFHVKFVQTDRWTNGWMDRRTTVEQYAPYLSIWGHNDAKIMISVFDRVENIDKQERQIVARYARLNPSCKAGACTGQNSSMKNNKGH